MKANTHVERLNRVFSALADGTRRGVMQQLATGPKAVSTLASNYQMALPSFMLHISILEKAGLIVSSKKGRVRTCRVKEDSLALPSKWLAEQQQLWATRLDQLDEYLLKNKTTKGKHNEN